MSDKRHYRLTRRAARVRRIVSVATKRGLARPEWRPLLMYGIDPRIVASIPRHREPRAQLFADIIVLVDQGAFAQWKANAALLLMPLRCPRG